MTKMLIVSAVGFLSSLMDLALPIVISAAIDQLTLSPETFDPIGASVILALVARCGLGCKFSETMAIRRSCR